MLPSESSCHSLLLWAHRPYSPWAEGNLAAISARKVPEQVEPSAHGWDKWKTITVAGGMEEYLARSSIQPSRPLCASPYAILQLHSLLHLILQPMSRPSALFICPQMSTLSPSCLCPCGSPVLEYLFPFSASGELLLILQGSDQMSPLLGSLSHF